MPPPPKEEGADAYSKITKSCPTKSESTKQGSLFSCHHSYKKVKTYFQSNTLTLIHLYLIKRFPISNLINIYYLKSSKL